MSLLVRAIIRILIIGQALAAMSKGKAIIIIDRGNAKVDSVVGSNVEPRLVRNLMQLSTLKT